MITYHVRHMGSMKRPTRLSHLEVQVPHEMTIRELVFYLLDRGETIGSREEYRDDPVDHLLIIVNGANVRGLQGSNTLLRDNDSIAILVPLFGG
jgi:molybdopterin converting factor small subunit